jgi:hypothetical protein
MADTQFIFGRKNQKSIGGIQIDAFVEEGHERSAQVTRYPIEDGSNISDHVIHDPDRLSINGVVGPSSIYSKNIQQETSTNRVLDCYLKLEELTQKGEPVTVVTGLKVYDSMIIESFSVQRNAQNGGSLDFTMSLSRIKTVKSQTVSMSNLGGTDKTKKQSKSNVSIGKTQGETPTQTSFLDNIRRKVRGQ